MAILFSHVTLSNEYYGTAEFLVSGYPQDTDDLQGWCAFDDYMDEVEDSCAIDVHVEAYLYGEGETVTATPEEVAYMMMRMNWDPEFLGDHCDNIGDHDFVIDWDGDEVFGYDWP